jgi:glycosyltransferase involved in cell wall biosynthesis
MQFTGWIDVHALAPYLYAADVLLIPPTSAPLQQHGNAVMPIKTYTYLAAGRVIVGPRQDDVREVLHDGENCLLVEPDQLDAAVAMVRAAFTDATRMAQIGAQAERDSALYTWEARARLIHDFIKQRVAATERAALVGNPRPAATT